MLRQDQDRRQRSLRGARRLGSFTSPFASHPPLVPLLLTPSPHLSCSSPRSSLPPLSIPNASSPSVSPPLPLVRQSSSLTTAVTRTATREDGVRAARVELPPFLSHSLSPSFFTPSSSISLHTPASSISPRIRLSRRLRATRGGGTRRRIHLSFSSVLPSQRSLTNPPDFDS